MEKIQKNKNSSARLVFVQSVGKERVLSSFIGKRTIELNIELLNDYKGNADPVE